MNGFTSLILQVTTRCNLHCDYCFQNQSRSNRDISPDNALRVFDWFLRQAPARTPLHFLFYGGEPLLLFGDVVQPVIRAGSGSQVAFEIITNGTLLSGDVLRVLRENAVRVLLSWDGAPEAQAIRVHGDASRFGEQLADIARHLTTTVRMTFNPNTVRYLLHGVTYLHQLGFSSIGFAATENDVWGPAECATLQEQLKEVMLYWTKHMSGGNALWIKPIGSYLQKMVDSSWTPRFFLHECFALKDTVAVSTEGLVHPCHRFLDVPGSALGDSFLEIADTRRELFNRWPHGVACRAAERMHPAADLNATWQSITHEYSVAADRLISLVGIDLALSLGKLAQTDRDGSCALQFLKERR